MSPSAGACVLRNYSTHTCTLERLREKQTVYDCRALRFYCGRVPESGFLIFESRKGTACTLVKHLAFFVYANASSSPAWGIVLGVRSTSVCVQSNDGIITFGVKLLVHGIRLRFSLPILTCNRKLCKY